MQSRLENLNENRIKLEVEVESTEVERALDEAYTRVAQKVNVPGFRKGKAPRGIIESRYGTEVLVEEALDILVPRTYLQALDEHKVEPIDRPDIDIVQPLEQGKSFVFTATVDILPKVTLGDYRSLRIPLKPAEVTDDQVDAELKELQQRRASLETSSKEAVETGNFAVINFAGFMDGKPFQGGAGEGYTLELGSNTFIPGFEEGMVGMRTGEKRNINVTFPADYRAEHLAGKDAVFEVELKEIKEKRLPEVGDELAKEVGFDSLDELKKNVRESLITAAGYRARDAHREEVVERVVEDAKVSVPDKLVDHEIEHLFEDLTNNMSSRGITMEQYQNAANKNEDQIKDDLRPEAVKSVRADLVLKAVADRENVAVSSDEIEHEVGRLARAYQQDEKKLYKRLAKEGRLESLAERLKRQKTLNLLAELALGGPDQKEE